MRAGHDWGDDFSMYLIHARNLAEGQSYFNTGYLLDAELPPIMAPPSYPPLFPLLLSPLYRTFGLNYEAFKLLVQFLFLLALLSIYVLARQRGLEPWVAALVGIVFAFSTIVLELKESVLSEGTYLTVAGATLCLALWIYSKQWDQRFPAVSAALLTVLILLGYATRATGLSLALALLGYELVVKRRPRRFNIYLVASLVVGLLFYVRVVYEGAGGYGNHFRFTPNEYVANALQYLRSPASLWGDWPAPVRWPLAGLLIVLAGVGYLRSLAQPKVTEFYVAATLAPLLLYSSGRADRYLVPVLPFLAIYAAEALVWMAGRLPSAGVQRRVLAGVFAAIVLVGATGNIAAIERAPITEGVTKTSFQEFIRFVQQTPPESRFIFWKPRLLSLYTKRTSAWYVYTDETARFLAFLKRIGASYVTLYRLNEFDQRWLRPHIERAPERFRLAFGNDDFTVYEVLPDPAPAQP
jgi:hypothetical protein